MGAQRSSRAKQGVRCAFVRSLEVKLVVKPGTGHVCGLVMGHGNGWPNLSKDLALIADWFDKHLRD